MQNIWEDFILFLSIFLQKLVIICDNV
jgi:hypothetical protein